MRADTDGCRLALFNILWNQLQSPAHHDKEIAFVVLSYLEAPLPIHVSFGHISEDMEHYDADGAQTQENVTAGEQGPTASCTVKPLSADMLCSAQVGSCPLKAFCDRLSVF